MAAGLPPDPALDPTVSPGQSGHIDDHEVIAGTLAMLREAAGMTVAEIGTDLAAAGAVADALALKADSADLGTAAAMTPTEVVEDAGAQAVLSGAFGVLAVAAYSPGTLAAYTNSTTTAADVDATNLAVTFTVPPSGKVLVEMSSWANQSAGSSLVAYWALREGSAVVANSAQAVLREADKANRAEYMALITGLTPGDVKTWKWAHYADAGGVSNIYAGAGFGQSVMKVEAVAS